MYCYMNKYNWKNTKNPLIKHFNYFLLKNVNYRFFEFFVLPLYSIVNVWFIQSYLKTYFCFIFYESQYIKINGWFFYHIFNTFMIAKYFPYVLNLNKMCLFVFGWEFIENVFVPYIGYISNNSFLIKEYREPLHDIFGDIIAAIPSFIFIYMYRNHKQRKVHKIKYL